MNTLLFIYLTLLPIGFNYGWLFQVGNRHASKIKLSFLCFTIVSLGFGAWGHGVLLSFFLSVCLSSCPHSFHLSMWTPSHPLVIDEHFIVGMFVHVCVCFMYEQRCLALFSLHSCSRNGLMCNPSRHFKGHEAWTDVVLLVYQMGLNDEKSVIPIQASLPSLVYYKAIHSFLLQGIISFFTHFQTELIFMLLLYLYLTSA